MEKRPAIVALVDRNGKIVAGRFDVEAVETLHRVERRDVEAFVASLVEDLGTRVPDRNKLGVPLAKRIAYLIQNRSQVSAEPVAEVNTERVEHVPEDPRKTEDPNGAAVQVDAGLKEVVFHPLPRRRAIARAVVAVEKAE
jgi:hypothetical protein